LIFLIRNRIKGVFSSRKAAILLTFATFVVAVGTIAFFYVEPVLPSGQKNTLFLSLYWTIETITTVGYGDIYPSNTIARFVFFFVILFGISSYALIATEVSAWVIDRKFMEFRGLHHMNMDEHIIIVGYNDSTNELIKQLRAHNAEYVVVDENTDASTLKANGIVAISGNPLSSDTLKRAGIEKADILIISDQADELAIMVTLKSRELNPSIKVIASCSRFEDFDIMKDANIDSVIPLSKMHGGILANAALDSGGAGFLMDLVTEDAGIALGEIQISEEKKLSSLSMRANERAIALVRDGRTSVVLDSSIDLKPGDVIITLHSSDRKVS
jgi:voltage-gated potassium channel